MTPDRVRHLVEGVLDDQGWSVYRLALGAGAPLIAVSPEGRALVIAVYRASEPEGTGRAYPRLDRIGTAAALASVTSSGLVTFHDALRPSGVENLADLISDPSNGSRARLVALPGGEAVKGPVA